MPKEIDISVLLATYNRADVLCQTLESMVGLDRDGLNVEFVVIDNNSPDHTKEVIESFTDRLPIRYLFESRPGKNCALNKALREVPLGKLVAFTDDDVEPKKDWLKRIKEISDRWPEYSVFGGKIYPIWPYPQVPVWAKNFKIEGFAFAVHNYANSECRYEDNAHPVGPNFWVRRSVFSDGRRYDEEIGPRPKNRILGSETSFLIELIKDGYRILYSPEAVVRHRVSPEQLSRKYIIKRAYRWGRGSAHIDSVCRATLLNKHRNLWYSIRLYALARAFCLLVLSLFSLYFRNDVERAVCAMRSIGYNLEILAIAAKSKANLNS